MKNQKIHKKNKLKRRRNQTNWRDFCTEVKIRKGLNKQTSLGVIFSGWHEKICCKFLIGLFSSLCLCHQLVILGCMYSLSAHCQQLLKTGFIFRVLILSGWLSVDWNFSEAELLHLPSIRCQKLQHNVFRCRSRRHFETNPLTVHEELWWKKEKEHLLRCLGI